MAAVLGNKRLAETTDIRVVEGLQNTNLPREALHLPSVIPDGVVVVVVVSIRVGPAQLLRMDDLDGEPLARGARHGPHDGGERAPAQLVRHVVKRVDAGELKRREVPIDVPIVLERVLLRHRRAKRDLVPVAQDARLSSDHARPVDLWAIEGASVRGRRKDEGRAREKTGWSGMAQRAEKRTQVPFVELSCTTTWD